MPLALFKALEKSPNAANQKFIVSSKKEIATQVCWKISATWPEKLHFSECRDILRLL